MIATLCSALWHNVHAVIASYLCAQRCDPLCSALWHNAVASILHSSSAVNASPLPIYVATLCSALLASYAQWLASFNLLCQCTLGIVASNVSINIHLLYANAQRFISWPSSAAPNAPDQASLHVVGNKCVVQNHLKKAEIAPNKIQARSQHDPKMKLTLSVSIYDTLRHLAPFYDTLRHHTTSYSPSTNLAFG